MLTINPSDRITAMEALQHPWFKLKLPKQETHDFSYDSLKNLSEFRANMKL